MAEELISNLGYETPQSDTKHQKLLECVLTGNSKLYLGKVYTEEKIKELSEEEVEKLFNNYEAKLSGQMVKSLGKSIINMYSIGACSALGITNQDAVSEDLENDPFLNSALQRFTCGLYYRFGSFLAPLTLWAPRVLVPTPSTKGGRGVSKRTHPSISRTSNATNLKPLEVLGVSFKVSKNFKSV